MREDAPFPDLATVIADEAFPRLDQALRSGRHIDRASPADYQLLSDAAQWLEPHYRRYGADLVQTSDGYFYLRPVGDRLPARRLNPAEMIVGQTLALFHLEPASLEVGGRITRVQLLERLRDLLGSDALVTALNRRRKGTAARHLAERKARQDIARALKTLARLGFIDLPDETSVVLRDPLMRFVEPVRGAGDLADALEILVRQGEIAPPDPLSGPDPEDPEGADDPEDDEADGPDDDEPDDEPDDEDLEPDAFASDEDPR